MYMMTNAEPKPARGGWSWVGLAGVAGIAVALAVGYAVGRHQAPTIQITMPPGAAPTRTVNACLMDVDAEMMPRIGDAPVTGQVREQPVSAPEPIDPHRLGPIGVM